MFRTGTRLCPSVAFYIWRVRTLMPTPSAHPLTVSPFLILLPATTTWTAIPGAGRHGPSTSVTRPDGRCGCLGGSRTRLPKRRRCTPGKSLPRGDSRPIQRSGCTVRTKPRPTVGSCDDDGHEMGPDHPENTSKPRICQPKPTKAGVKPAQNGVLPDRNRSCCPYRPVRC